MNDRLQQIRVPPIVEAVLDIDCDMPPAFDLVALEPSAHDALGHRYPKLRKQFIQEHLVVAPIDGAPRMTSKQGIQALQFLQDDEKQLVQVRAQGFSFNRLAPYVSLDDYLPEMERTWRLFADFAAPVQIRLIRLRYINRILLPLTEGRVDLDDYLNLGPRLPDEDKLTFVGFLNQHSAVDAGTGNRVNIVLATQPAEGDSLPVIFDIETLKSVDDEPSDWPLLSSKIQSLRELKNLVFEKTLTDKCLKLFQ